MTGTHPTLTCYACRGKALTMAQLTHHFAYLYYVCCPACGTHTHKALSRKAAENEWKTMQLDWLVQKRKQQKEVAP